VKRLSNKRRNCFVDLTACASFKNDNSADRKQVIFTDNFDTQHTMAKQLNYITDGNTDAMNQLFPRMAIRNL
jgi:hypothetical protein